MCLPFSPGIVFDTHEGEGELFCCMEECLFFLPGIVFDTHHSEPAPLHYAGIVFDTYVNMWHTFAELIPSTAGYRFRYPCTKQVNYNRRVSESSLPSFCMKFSMLTMRSAEGRFVPLM